MLVVAAVWLLCGRVAAQVLPSVPTTVLTYDVAEKRTHKHVYTLRGWNEAAESGHIIAASNLRFPQGNSIDIRATFTREEPPRCLSWQALVKDANGTVVASAVEHVVPEAFPFLAEPVPPDTYPPLAPIGYIITRLGLGEKDTASFHFILMGMSILQMNLWTDGREPVEVPAGTFDCYRVRMRVDPGSLFPTLPGFLQPFVRFFVPTHTMWLTAERPQVLVKYTGQMGPPGSPELLIQLTGTEPQAGPVARVDVVE